MQKGPAFPSSDLTGADAARRGSVQSRGRKTAKCLEINDNFIILTAVVMVFTFALTVFMIFKIYKWSREGTLSEPIPALASA